MAESIFNQMKSPGSRAISAGTNPAKEVNPLVVEALREIGIAALVALDALRSNRRHVEST